MCDLDFLELISFEPTPLGASAPPSVAPDDDVELMDAILGTDDAPNACKETLANPKFLCFCESETCTNKYKRKLRHRRVLEQSNQLQRYYNGGKLFKNVQIQLPKEIQAHIGYGSCNHIFDAFKLFLKYVQLELGWAPKPQGYACKLPTEAEYMRARNIMMRLGLSVDFYVNVWVPTFNPRFVEACSGMHLLQVVTERFLTAKKFYLLYGSEIIFQDYDL